MAALSFLETLGRGTVLGDGGYVFELEHRGYIQAGPYTPEVLLEHPEAVYQLSVEFRRAGAEVLQALTFYGDHGKMSVVGRQSSVGEANREAIRIARRAAGPEGYVAGGLTQTPSFRRGQADQPDAYRVMSQQMEIQATEGVDLFIGETFLCLEEALLALRVLRQSGKPVILAMNVGPQGSAEGVPAEECARRLEDAGADGVGVNCSFDPDMCLESARRMAQATKLPVLCQPVAYATSHAKKSFTHLPEFPLALERLQLTRFEMATFARKAQDAGIRFIGGCCGVSPYHIRSMAEALGRSPPASAKSPSLAQHALPDIRERAPAAYWNGLAR